MDLLAIIRIAMRALARNKLRSILTMLGIIIGVGAVIAMVSVGQGAQLQAQQQIAAMGSNMLFVQSGTVNKGGMRMGWGATKTLVYDDMVAILRECPSVSAAAPGSQASAQVVFGNDNWATNINGTEPQYFDIRSWPFAEGTSFTQDDVSTAANVAVIGETVRKNLFGATDPVGQTVRINNLSFKVVGLLTPKGTSAAMGQDQDDVILVPITTLQKKITGQDWLRWIMVSALSKDASYTAQQQITALLARSPPHPSGTGRRFLRPQPGRHGGPGRPECASLHHIVGLDCQHFAACRRHRHHEYHAGIGHRAYPRDWYPHGDRRN